MKYPEIPGLDLTIHSIFCIGRNYELHALEMGHKSPSKPMVFLKPLSSICYNGANIRIPKESNDVHHEVELLIAIGKGGKNIPKEDALQHIAGYGIGIDFTARDLQAQAKEKGHPWSVAKGFDDFAPISSFVRFQNQNELDELSVELKVNGITRQKGITSDMIFDIPTLVSYLSTIFTLSEGDIIFTGTPMGVSAVQSGDVVEAVLDENKVSLTVTIA
ncbi:MAG: fumarylacetoacetate hydrolase family protein [Balneolaceae bacterium]